MTYFLVGVKAGNYHVQAHTDHDFGVEIDAQPGNIVFIEHQLTLLFGSVRGHLEVVSESEGKAMVNMSLRTESAADAQQRDYPLAQ